MSILIKIKPSEIAIEERARFEKGDIKELAESIKKDGLLSPITVDKDNKLKDGGRRLEAWKLTFGDAPIDAYVPDKKQKEPSIVTELRMERYAKKFTYDEKYRAGKILEKKYKNKFKTRRELYTKIAEELGFSVHMYKDLNRVLNPKNLTEFTKYEKEKIRKTMRKKGLDAALKARAEIASSKRDIPLRRFKVKRPDINEAAFNLYMKITEINSMLDDILPHLSYVKDEIIQDIARSLYALNRVITDNKSDNNKIKLLEVKE